LTVADDARTDLGFFGLEAPDAAGRCSFTVTMPLSRLDGRLYGGTAIGVSVVVAEAATGRTSLWTTTQFVSTVETGTAVDVLVEVLAPGRRTNQVRVTGTGPDGAVVFASLGATGHLRPTELVGTFDSRPDVSDPADSGPLSGLFDGLRELAEERGEEAVRRLRQFADRGFNSVLELRTAEVREHPAPGPGRFCLWARRRDAVPVTPAMAAFIADVVPMSVSRALGSPTLGTSLDNTLRVNDPTPSDWVLLDLHPHAARGDYAHGTVHVWNTDGGLLGTASQTAAIRSFDPANPPWAP
jgi:acyl-CoA thioesterase